MDEQQTQQQQDYPRAHATKPRAAPKRQLHELPEDDPFVLIDRLDAQGGVNGLGRRMSSTAMAAFREYCLLPPPLRSVKQLYIHLNRTWHAPAGRRHASPDQKTLMRWSREYEWDELVRVYDQQLARWELLQQQHQHDEVNERQAKNGVGMQNLAASQIQSMIERYNAPQMPLTDQRTGTVLLHPRSGKPIFPPKPTLNGLQALALLYKIGVETERTARGLPNQITDQRLEAHIESQNVTVGVTLEEWRRLHVTERLAAAGGVESGGGGGSTPAMPPVLRGLPAPRPALAALSEDERAQLPAGWVDADP